MELAASTFLVNLARKQGMEHILWPYINCGVRECHTCMAPVGSSKNIYNSTNILGPPSTKYLAHRQDQSVLSLSLGKVKPNIHPKLPSINTSTSTAKVIGERRRKHWISTIEKLLLLLLCKS
jgi:ferredoxin